MAEKELGLPIPDEAIEEMKNNLVRLFSSLRSIRDPETFRILRGVFRVAPGQEAV
jgi:hypothetical protein